MSLFIVQARYPLVIPGPIIPTTGIATRRHGSDVQNSGFSKTLGIVELRSWRGLFALDHFVLFIRQSVSPNSRVRSDPPPGNCPSAVQNWDAKSILNVRNQWRKDNVTRAPERVVGVRVPTRPGGVWFISERFVFSGETSVTSNGVTELILFPAAVVSGSGTEGSHWTGYARQIGFLGHSLPMPIDVHVFPAGA